MGGRFWKIQEILEKYFYGIIYILIIILICKFLNSAFQGTRITITAKLSENIRKIRISEISEFYEAELETKNSKPKNKELYVEKVYKKLIEEPTRIQRELYNNVSANKSINDNVNNNKVENNRINASEIVIPNFGNIFAKLYIPDCGISANVVFGLTQDLVDNFDVAMQDSIASVYVNPMLPGYNRPLLMGGHNYKSLGKLKNILVGSTITLTTNYGTFYYSVTEAKKAKLNVHGTTLIDIDSGSDLITYFGSEQLQIYTCDNLNDSTDPYRFFVRAVKISGTEIIF